MSQHCKAYRDIEAKALAEGRMLTLGEMCALIEADAETAQEFKRINSELECGLGLDAELISERVHMPVAFVTALLATLAIRTVAFGNRPPEVARTLN